MENSFPFEKLYNIKHNYNKLRVFGCKCYILNDNNDKLSSKPIICIFIGFFETKKGLNVMTQQKIMSMLLEMWHFRKMKMVSMENQSI